MKFTKFELQHLESILEEYIEFMKKAKRNKISRDGSAEYYPYAESHTILSKITGELTKEERKRRQAEIEDTKKTIKSFEEQVQEDKKRHEKNMEDWKKLIIEKKNDIKKLREGKEIY